MFLSPESRLRHLLIAREVRSGWAAISRGDLKLMFVRYTPDLEFVADAGFQSLGFASRIQGRDAARAYIQTVKDAWREWEFSPRALIDLGDRLVTVGVLRAAGSLSGVPIEREFAQLLELRNGLVAREHDFWEVEPAFAAAGLRRDQIRGLDEQLAVQ